MPTFVIASAREAIHSLEAFEAVIPGRCEASNPESRDSPMCNCTSAVWCLRTIPGMTADRIRTSRSHRRRDAVIVAGTGRGDRQAAVGVFIQLVAQRADRDAEDV